MSWWDEQCPQRGPALSHAHWDRCTAESHPGEDSGHMAWQCCHCRGFAPPIPEPHTMVMPPLDVTARLRSLGLLPEETEMEDIRQTFERDDDTPFEPRMSKGIGLTEREWYEAVLPVLTTREQKRVAGYVELARRRGVKREQEEAQ